KTFELGDVERRLTFELLEYERMRETRRTLERAQRALEPALPAVRERERLGRGPVLRRGDGERAQALPLCRRVAECPRQGGERAPCRRALDVLARKQAHDLV